MLSGEKAFGCLLKGELLSLFAKLTKFYIVDSNGISHKLLTSLRLFALVVPQLQIKAAAVFHRITQQLLASTF